jgi:hypothetical protein
VFGQTDCSMASGGALSRSSSCSDEVDIGGTGDPTAVNVSQCQ